MQAIAILDNHGYILINQIHKNKILMIFNLKNFKKFSTHAIHIHEYGDTTKGCLSLGGHYNPDKKNHGHLNIPERHKGDLFNNFTTDVKGNFYYEFLDDLNINDLFGRSIVIHYLQDDLGLKCLHTIPYSQLSDEKLKDLCDERGYKNLYLRQERINKLNSESLITGNAGKRLICGIIARKDPNKE